MSKGIGKPRLEPLVGDIFRQRPLAPDPSAPIPAAFVRSPSWHPLLYRKRIDRVEKGRPGDLIAVYGPNDRVLGYGLYNPAQRDRRPHGLLRRRLARRHGLAEAA